MINTFPLSLSANVELVLDVAPSTCISLHTAASSIKVRFDENSNWTPMRQGDDIGPSPREFTKITLLSTTAQSVTVLVGDTQILQSTNVNVNATATVAIANSNPGVLDVTITANSSAQIIGANSNRKSVMLRSIPENVAAVRLGNAVSVGATTGFRLDPDESVTIPTEGAVYGFNTSLTDTATITIIELERL